MPTDAYHDDIDAFLRLWGEPTPAELRLWTAALAPLGDHTRGILASWAQQSERRPHPHELLLMRVDTSSVDRMRHIAREIAHSYGLPIDEICGPKRHLEIAIPRHHVMHALREAGFSFTRIGKFLKRDHTTVMQGVKAHVARAAESSSNPVSVT